jgi:hypothetical protein
MRDQGSSAGRLHLIFRSRGNNSGNRKAIFTAFAPFRIRHQTSGYKSLNSGSTKPRRLTLTPIFHGPESATTAAQFAAVRQRIQHRLLHLLADFQAAT